ncbi:MAG: protein-methionine-sulfoxide reductase catalytic subunit MsrP [Candidatus Latescibacteria bacterium]|nr:protein-methionine-sulfoxide reductase catalytic subunit MsrP [Candidatus Latescibacterota bacterium]
MPRKGWEIPQRQATDEAAFFNRRKFIRQAGLGAIGLLSGCSYEKSFEPVHGQEAAPLQPGPAPTAPDTPGGGLYPAPLNPAFASLDRPLTTELSASRYNNFYEFSLGKSVYLFVDNFEPNPWTVEIAGLVQQPRTFDVDQLIGLMDLEERLYRHRCVEAWSMALPWTGFPLQALIAAVQPLAAAKYLRFTSFFKPEQAPGQWDSPNLPWAYTEGLSMAEATNELAFIATGIYGHELPKQHGAPLRLVTPWKYGYKGIKSITKIEFTSEQPATFWNTLVPEEYSFLSNVEPEVPHPRWSQASERFIKGNNQFDRLPTLPYNGYGEYVAHLYG